MPNVETKAPRKSSRRALWSLWRIDDNGVEYEMESGLTKVDAQEKLADFECRHHKQTYFLRKST